MHRSFGPLLVFVHHFCPLESGRSMVRIFFLLSCQAGKEKVP